MFPLQDDVPIRIIPVVNYATIATCLVVFFGLQLPAADQGQRLVEEYGLIPLRITQPGAPLVIKQPQAIGSEQGAQVLVREEIIQTPSTSSWMTFVTCMFLHGSVMHVLGNMWFLWIFGDNLEDRFGHLGFAIVYLLTGLVAGVIHLLSDPGSPIPTIGASGAIAGVMGAYFVLYPGAQVLALVPIGPVARLLYLPAPLFLGLWLVFQFVSAAQTSPGGGGVAWWAHIGGFIAGLLVGLMARLVPGRA